MPALATQRWSDRLYVKGNFAQLAWDVVSVDGEEQAIAAANVSVGNTHPQDARLTIPNDGISFEFTAPRSGVLRARYTTNIVTGGSPLDEPLELWPDFASDDKPIVQDAFGNPITNSARIPFVNELTDPFDTPYVTVSRWESTYDIQKAMAFKNKINSDNFIIPKVGLLLPGQAKLLKYRCEKPFLVTDQYVRVNYIFELRPYYQFTSINAGAVTVTGFARRVEDKGAVGFYTDNGGTLYTGPIVFKASGDEVSDDVKLAGTGVPFDPNFYAVHAPSGDVPSPTQMPNTVPVEKTATGAFLYYVTPVSIAFSGLNLPQA